MISWRIFPSRKHSRGGRGAPADRAGQAPRCERRGGGIGAWRRCRTADGRELERQLLQDHLDLRAATEEREEELPGRRRPERASPASCDRATPERTPQPTTARSSTRPSRRFPTPTATAPRSSSVPTARAARKPSSPTYAPSGSEASRPPSPSDTPSPNRSARPSGSYPTRSGTRPWNRTAPFVPAPKSPS